MNLSEYYLEKNFIHHSNCHEDFLLLDKYISPKMKEVLSAASSLDNSLSFLVHKNLKVHAFDSNPAQIYLCKLKKCAIENFTYKNFLIFIGIEQGDKLSLYEKLKKNLEPQVKEYFDSHLYLIENGIVNIGRFEYYLQTLRTKILPFVCSIKSLRSFSKAETIEEQQFIYEKNINTLRFKVLFRIIFSKFFFVFFGRGKDHKIDKNNSFSKILKERIDIGFSNILNLNNPYIGFILNKKYKELPFYLQKENYKKIKANIDNLEIEQKTFSQMMTQNYDFMSLSYIFEFEDKRKMPDYSEVINQHLNENGIVAFWNFVNVRNISSLRRINGQKDFLQDRAFFYRDFLVYEK